jgi:hypothetical protein
MKPYVMGALLGYAERESHDPITGEVGVLRKEWRVRELSAFSEQELADAWGPDWRRYKPTAQVVLEMRYIRRGVEEPWRLFESAYDVADAVTCTDSGIVACCAELASLLEKRRVYATEQEALKRAESERLRQERTQEDLLRRSRACWERMLEQADNRQWAIAWNEAIERCREQRVMTALKQRPEFIALHAAVVESTAAPKKRVAIRKALAWLENNMKDLSADEPRD